MSKLTDVISPAGEFFIYFLIFYVFLLLKRYFFIHQSASTFLNVILHIGISIMQWVIILSIKRLSQEESLSLTVIPFILFLIHLILHFRCL